MLYFRSVKKEPRRSQRRGVEEGPRKGSWYVVSSRFHSPNYAFILWHSIALFFINHKYFISAAAEKKLAEDIALKMVLQDARGIFRI